MNVNEFGAFKASRFSDDNDPLLANHPNNPALQLSEVPYFCHQAPMRQYLYKIGKGYGLIAEHEIRGITVYSMWWGQGGDEYYNSLDAAELALFLFFQ